MKNHKEKTTNKKSPQQLLVEIRNLITPQLQEKSYNHLSPHEIEEMLKESHEQTQSIKKSRISKPNVVEKIKEASDFVKNQNQFSLLQQYTKEKITSEVFAPIRGNISEAEAQYFQRQREELLKQRMLQQQEERQREAKVIESTKKFNRYESKKLPYAEINQFIMKQGSSSMNYLLSQQPQKTEISINNRVDDSKAEDLQQRYQKMKGRNLSAANQISKVSPSKDDGFGEIVIVDDDETLNQDYLREQTQINLTQSLKQSPRLLRVLKHILLKQVALMKILNDESSSRNRSSVNRSETNFKYKNHPIHLAKKVSQPNPQKIADLTKQYKSKGIVLREMGVRSALKPSRIICTKVVNKMNGNSSEFHPRKAQLTENQLIWNEQKDEIGDNSKKVMLTIQAVKTRKATKEEGSFFSKQTSEVEVVLLEGTNRSIIFQKNYLEGSEMYQQLCNLMAQKIYNLNIIIGCRVNQNLSDFIYNKKANCFDMSNQFLQAHDKYPSREYRLMIIGIFGSLFALRSEVTKVLLASCRMNAEENNKLFKALCFQKLQQLIVTQTKINSQSLKSLTTYLSTLKTSKVSLTISNCMIDDQMLLSSKQNILECTNINKLNLSLNAFGVLGLSVINQLAEKEGCTLSELNISENSIANLAVLGDLIKKCRTLEVVLAQNCGFSFDSQDQLKIFFQNLKNCRLRKLSLLRNELVNHLKSFQDFWVNDTPKQINIQLGIYAEKTSKNLQGRLIE